MRPDAYWPDRGPGGEIRRERHFGVEMRCFSQRPPHVDAMFRATVARFGAREALVADDVRLSYRDLDRLVDWLAAGLRLRGVGSGDRVVLLLGNCPEFLVAVLACARLGAVSVPVSIRHTRSEVEHVVADCAAVALIFETALCDSAPAARASSTLRTRIAVGAQVDGAELIEDVMVASRAPRAPAPVREEDTAILLYTSGTTGKPKGAMLTHLGIVHSVLHYARCFDLRESDRTLLAVPAAHVTGVVALLLATVNAGGCSVMLRAFRASEFLVLAEKETITYTLMVPAMYMLCRRDELMGSVDLSAWRIGAFGGSPMPDSAVAALAATLPNLSLRQAYGATETTSPATLTPPGLGTRMLDTVGQVVPCGEIRVVDESGHQVPHGVPGEILIRGPMVVPGYWNNAAANRRDFEDGFWRSGDVGSMDADGFVRVFDRVKDMINRGGYKIFSAEVENVLSAHPEVLECAVIAHPDPILCERVKAVIVPRSRDVPAEEFRAYCAQQLADYKVPELIELRTEALPRNANGKVLKRALRTAEGTQLAGA
jgi:long-chain acyl-CoA synthetase